MSSRRATVVAAILLWRCGALLDVPEKPELAAAEHRVRTPRRAAHPREPSSLEPASSADDVMDPARSAPVAAAADAGDGSALPSASPGSLNAEDGGVLVEPPEPLPPAREDAGLGAAQLAREDDTPVARVSRAHTGGIAPLPQVRSDDRSFIEIEP